MIEVTVIQLVCLVIIGINCGITIWCAKDSVKKWKEANKALEISTEMLKFSSFLRNECEPKNTDPLTSEEN